MKGPSGCQLSYHNDVFFPLTKTLTRYGWTMGLRLSSFLETQDGLLGILSFQKFLPFIEYDLTHWHYIDCSPPEMRSQMCFAMAALFYTCMDLNPSTPSCSGEHRCSQATLAPVLLRSGPDQRKALRFSCLRVQ